MGCEYIWDDVYPEQSVRHLSGVARTFWGCEIWILVPVSKLFEK
ncbi:hypothetical protein SPWS13_1552 [Shewanella putrefaciens]|nr:hypothetical protein SPWS13_1552 [Shewanella putrefaciens]